MFVNMDIQWAATFLGCVAAILVPVPIFFYLYGHKLRQESKWAPTLPAAPSSEEETGGEDNGEKETRSA
jgi:DHA1 family multidrug resistance protein-like MFS transporter